MQNNSNFKSKIQNCGKFVEIENALENPKSASSNHHTRPHHHLHLHIFIDENLKSRSSHGLWRKWIIHWVEVDEIQLSVNLKDLHHHQNHHHHRRRLSLSHEGCLGLRKGFVECVECCRYMLWRVWRKVLVSCVKSEDSIRNSFLRDIGRDSLLIFLLLASLNIFLIFIPPTFMQISSSLICYHSSGDFIWNLFIFPFPIFCSFSPEKSQISLFHLKLVKNFLISIHHCRHTKEVGDFHFQRILF